MIVMVVSLLELTYYLLSHAGSSRSKDALSVFCKQVQSHYQEHSLSERLLLDAHVTASLALIDCEKSPNARDPFFQSTIDLLKEKIPHFKNAF